MKILRPLAVVAVVGAAASCSGTETDNPIDTETGRGPLLHFESSPCKRESEPAPGEQPLVVASEAEGLQCFAWEQEDFGPLKLRLLNFDAGCVASWIANAQTVDGAIEITIANPGCQVASCGSCLYDFDFELTRVEAAELPVRVTFKICPSAAPFATYDVTLPLEDTLNGSLCRPVPRGPLGWYALTTSRCGAYNMPCGAECNGDTGCDEGLTCVAIDEAEDYRCLQACTADEDCSSPINSCQSETCRPTATF